MAIRNSDKFNAFCDEIERLGYSYDTKRGKGGWHITLATQEEG